MTQKDILIEIDATLSERRTQWRRVPSTSEVLFVSPDHQRQYDTMQAAYVVFQTMYAAEFHQIVTRIERLRREAEAQTELKL